jgi:VWFA-related protein
MRPLTSLSTAIFVLASLAAAFSAPAQQPAVTPPPAQQPQAATPASTITVDAKLVIVPAIVRDKKNGLIANLTRENFALTVDGKPQTLRYFDHDSNVPITAGLLIDTSQSVRSVLDEERTASATFVEKMLAPERDQAFVIQFAHGVELLQDVTKSRPLLEKALKEVDTPNPTLQRSDNSQQQQQQQGGRGGYGHGGQNSSGGTALYDAVFLASDEVINKQQGRRALILLTDGDDRGSLKSITQAIEAAQRADTMIYAIYYKGEDHGGFNGFPGGRHGGGFPGHYFGQGRGGYGQQRPDGKKILERMAGETGGRVYEVSKKDTVEKIYAEIGEELRSQYRLGFTPSTEAASEGYHKIFITLAGQPEKDKDLVYGRDGYYR